MTVSYRSKRIYDNFFDLGGHSLTASRVISRVIQTFQLELPVKALFDSTTVAEMAVIITANQAKRASNAELAQMLCEVKATTEDVAQRLISENNSPIATSNLPFRLLSAYDLPRESKKSCATDKVGSASVISVLEPQARLNRCLRQCNFPGNRTEASYSSILRRG